MLIRHADQYVTAYANDSKLLVHRGEHVRRGQVIARAGQTGNVTSPQLHFEIPTVRGRLIRASIWAVK